MRRLKGIWRLVVLCLCAVFFICGEVEAQGRPPSKMGVKSIKEFLTSVTSAGMKWRQSFITAGIEGQQFLITAKKKGQQLAAAGVVVLTVCTGFSCAVRYEVPSQIQYTAAELFGMHVHFTVDGVDYVGEVSHSDAVHAKKVTIDLYDGRQAENVPVDYIKGTLVPVHEDEGVSVYLPSDEEGVAFLHGIVVAVYTSGAREVSVNSKVDINGKPATLDQPYTVIVMKEDIIWADPLE